MRITKRVNEFPDPESSHMGNHMREERIGRYVKRNSNKYVCTSLI